MSNTTDDSVVDRLGKVGEQLRIPTDTLQITQVRLDQLNSETEVEADNIDNIAAAALAVSCREDGLPVTERDIANTWSETLETPEEEITISHEQLEAVSSYIDIEEVPPHPNALIQGVGEAIEMPEELVNVGHRLLRDIFQADPSVVASERSPAVTASAVLSLATQINEADDTYSEDAIGEASGTSTVMVGNRRRELEELLGEEQLRDGRYRLTDGTETAGDQSTAADGAGTAKEAEADETASDAHEGSPDTDSGPSVGGVETEIDSLVDELDVEASTRLMARGMVSDAVGEIETGTTAELAGATVVAAARLEGGDSDAVTVAGMREFEPRNVVQMLDELDRAVDIDIPRRDADEVVADLVDELELPDTVREEGIRSLERYEDEAGTDYTPGELGAGAVMFAATVGRTQVDIDDLSAVSGADPDYITDAMSNIVVSLCLALIRGEIDYADCSWATDLLESELSPEIGDSHTGRVITLAKTYVAGREGVHVDDATLEVVLDE